MSVVETFDAMSKRMPWREVASKVIRVSGGDPRRGWDKTKEAADEGEFDQINLQKLEDFYREHLLIGEKYSKFYQLSPADANQLRGDLGNLTPNVSPYSPNFPFPIDEAALSLLDGGMHLMDVLEDDGGTGVIVCSDIALTTKEEISVSDYVKTKKIGVLNGRYDAIYGMKREHVQLFHTVWLPHDSDVLEIRVDDPNKMPERLIHQLHSNLRTYINKLVGWNLPSRPVELLPAINNIYRTADEGRVVEMTFTTTATNSVKNERMRRARGDIDCLRKETFHCGGMEAVGGDIEPFHLCVQWEKEVGGDFWVSPEVSLSPTSRSKAYTGPTVSGVAFRNCFQMAQYESLRDVVLAYSDPDFEPK